MKTALVTLFALAASTALAQEDAAPPPAPPAPPVVQASPAEPSAAAVNVVSDRSIGVHVAANVGLFEVDGQVGHFYAFAAGSVGMPLLSEGQLGFGMMGAGYTFALSPPSESMWYMDVLALGTAGRTGYDVVAGGGLGLGFRYLHRSGFTFSAKIPVFGATGQVGRIDPYAYGSGYSGSQSVGNFYLASLVSLPMVSFGYRF